ncbi:ATPase [synthetic Mycoplasma mycoides JCVI-syn1.0]|uniref:ATPase n=1 Tax=Mycoplasma mycoides subsp. capri TaxID=40477 RepID=A0AB38GDR7_MYCMC|nr:ATP-binding protein [Mycoplasma mycoides]ADH21614.1 ATPase [synthetic Mycoplasma mycoides JCVI-syn1.0]ACU78385.1 ATPase [Mycoplasma mycoides subsp. capri str. GM12]ACU79214.1 ATPase [Mycoplasma mycoides subsp. capri str. GM12]SRX61252.1 ATPase [Mycoplasma mycoides subsp. capri]SRX62651.1 ATPase [Mycoplasma mycoides subsp. capri]
MQINRDYYLNKLISKKNNNKIKVITGIKNVGKSYLLFNIYKNYLLSIGINEDQIITLKLDKWENANYRKLDSLYNYIKQRTSNPNKTYYVFIDEIQYCETIKQTNQSGYEQILTFVDVILSFYDNPNIDLYITGSNSKMLSSDILTNFRGRSSQIKVYPLVFSEVNYLFKNDDEALDHYINYGGLPEVYLNQTIEEKKEYLTNQFEEIYLKDIKERYNIQKEITILETLLKFVSSAIGSFTNPTKLQNRFKSEMKTDISSNTIANYLSYFENSFILSHIKKYDVKGNKHFSTINKYYFTDIGLRNACINYRQIESNHIIENIIYNELVKRNYSVYVSSVEYQTNSENKRTTKQLEVDFVIQKASKKYYIQFAMNVYTKQKKEQEINSLLRIKDNFKKIVIVYDDIEPRYDENGILYIGLKQFLLDENIIDF